MGDVVQQFGHNGNGNVEHTVERLRGCLPLRLLAILAGLNKDKHTGRLVINYNEGRAVSVETRRIEKLRA